ncbi:MAG: TetR/AcrR family transcriptional regulator [Deltaproteobacteria bacterium]|nr:MAG: TetR/AcrR family transcriptional regulator [Deltaproteobacteria bacterium]
MPKIVDHEAYRKELLGKAFTLFAAQGYARVTMRAMARALGVSTGTLYHYFDTKEAIFLGVVRHVADRDVALAIEQVQGASGHTEQFRRLLAFVREHAANLRNFLYLVIDFHRQSEDPSGRDIIARTVAFYREAIRQQLGGDTHDEARAALLLNALIGALVQEALDPEAPPLETQLTLVERLFVDLEGSLPATGT